MIRRSRARQLRHRGAHAVARLRLCSNSTSGDGGSLGTSTAGSVALSSVSRLASGDVDSIVLMRTIVRSSRDSSVPTRLRQVGQRRFGAQLAAQLLAGRFEFAADAANAARPGVATQRVDHGAPHAALGKGLELDAAAPRRTGAPRPSDPARRPGPDRSGRSSGAWSTPSGGPETPRRADRRQHGLADDRQWRRVALKPPHQPADAWPAEPL